MSDKGRDGPIMEPQKDCGVCFLGLRFCVTTFVDLTGSHNILLHSEELQY